MLVAMRRRCSTTEMKGKKRGDTPGRKVKQGRELGVEKARAQG